MPQGQVKWFDPKKGYGFIVGPDGQDVFVHYSHIQSDGFRSLKDGEWVDYEITEGEKGWQARNVHQSGNGSSESSPSAGYENPDAAPSSPRSGYAGEEDEASRGD